MSSRPTAATAAGSDAGESAFTFLPQGALIQEFKVAGVNIVQGFPEAKFYKTHNAPYFGETIGRTTNRIKDAKIENLNGRTYALAANDPPNSLHGGKEGWGKKDFEGPKPVYRNGREGVEFRYLSKDGEEGYPGTVECRVWYTAGMEDGKTVLDAEWEVEFVGDECEETVVGVTNHRYDSLLAKLIEDNSKKKKKELTKLTRRPPPPQLLQPQPPRPHNRRHNRYAIHNPAPPPLPHRHPPRPHNPPPRPPPQRTLHPNRHHPRPRHLLHREPRPRLHPARHALPASANARHPLPSGVEIAS